MRAASAAAAHASTEQRMAKPQDRRRHCGQWQLRWRHLLLLLLLLLLTTVRRITLHGVRIVVAVSHEQVTAATAAVAADANAAAVI